MGTELQFGVSIVEIKVQCEKGQHSLLLPWVCSQKTHLDLELDSEFDGKSV